MRGTKARNQFMIITVLAVILVFLLSVLIVLKFTGDDDKEEVSSSESEVIVIPEEPSEEESESSKEESIEESKEESREESEEIKEEVKPKPQKPAIPYISTYDEIGKEYKSKEHVSHGYIRASDVVLKNKTFEENLYITDKASDSTVVLEDVTVKGTILIEGSSEIILENCQIGDIIVSTKNDINKIIATGSTEVNKITTKNNCLVDEKRLADGARGVKSLMVSKECFNKVTDVKLKNALINSMEVYSPTDLHVDSHSKVEVITAFNSLHTGGLGDVGRLRCYSEHVSYSFEPDEIEVGKGFPKPQQID